jgi:mono/diheme cytochrome c family protein
MIVFVLIGVAAAMSQRRARTDLGGIAGADPTDPARVAVGQQIYATRCASCHAADLAGQPNWQEPLPNGVLAASPLDASGNAWRRSDQALFAIIRDGGQAVAPPGIISAMPGFGGGLSDEQIWAVLTYIKSTWPQPTQTAQPRP